MSLYLEHPRKLVRFAEFELDPVSGELRRGNSVHHLQPQPLKLLLALLERPGELVTREQLKQDLMPDAAYGDFDHALNLAVSKLRAALGDSPEQPRYIETIPRRGYRLVGSIDPAEIDAGQSPPEPTARAPSRAPRHGRRARWLWLAACLAAALLATWTYYRTRLGATIKEKDTVVIADFTNNTSDPVFTDTLREGLQVQLGQSPFLNLLPDEKVKETLKLMGRQPQDSLSDPVAREVCQRNGSKAYIAGSISTLGSEYVLGLKAVDCLSGKLVVHEQGQVARKEEVLQSLDKQASELRIKLGESLASIQKSNLPLADVTTSSLEALQAYTRAGQSSDPAVAINLFERAVELDPNFAMAYLALYAMYGNSSHSEQAKQNADKAYELRDRITHRERLHVEARHYVLTGEMEKAAQIYETLKSLYPQRSGSYSSLDGIYSAIGQHEKSMENSLAAYRLGLDGATAFNLTNHYLSLNKLEEASRLIADAQARHIASEDIALLSYDTAFLRNDKRGMEQISQATYSPQFEPWMASYHAQGLAYYGQFRNSTNLLRDAIALANQQHDPDSASLAFGIAAMSAASVGSARQAGEYAADSLVEQQNKQSFGIAALAYAQAGDTRKAQVIARELAKGNPQDTILNTCILPSVRAFLELHANRPAQALEVLQAVTPYEAGWCFFQPFIAVYARGQAYLALHNGPAAAAEFQRILDNRNIVRRNEIGALAHLGLARAYVLQGDTAKARTKYEDFLTLWKDADADIPIYQQARAEYGKLR